MHAGYIERAPYMFSVQIALWNVCVPRALSLAAFQAVAVLVSHASEFLI